MTTTTPAVAPVPSRRRRWLRHWLAIAMTTLATLALAGEKPMGDPTDESQVARGQAIYLEQCASCHGVNLEGHPNWKERLPSGRMPPPPHDASGHTWHHPDAMLFGIIQRGMAPFAWKGYESDMPAFGATLSDEAIWSVLAYLKSTWPDKVRASQAEVSEQARRRAEARANAKGTQ